MPWHDVAPVGTGRLAAPLFPDTACPWHTVHPLISAKAPSCSLTTERGSRMGRGARLPSIPCSLGTRCFESHLLFYGNRGFLPGIFRPSLGFGTVLFLPRTWSCGGRVALCPHCRSAGPCRWEPMAWGGIAPCCAQTMPPDGAQPESCGPNGALAHLHPSFLGLGEAGRQCGLPAGLGVCAPGLGAATAGASGQGEAHGLEAVRIVPWEQGH